jgi:hypothetical protein
MPCIPYPADCTRGLVDPTSGFPAVVLHSLNVFVGGCVAYVRSQGYCGITVLKSLCRYIMQRTAKLNMHIAVRSYMTPSGVLLNYPNGTLTMPGGGFFMSGHNRDRVNLLSLLAGRIKSGVNRAKNGMG